jgi:ABC-type dipeptide/oligopeptide/nickel transport system permease component
MTPAPTATATPTPAPQRTPITERQKALQILIAKGYSPEAADQWIKANLEAAYGLDRPLHEQYLRYLSGLMRGDFGPSFKFKDFSVTELIAQGLPISLMLGLSAVLLALLVGIPLGAMAALRHNSGTDYSIMGFAVLGIALPSFVTGPLFALVFGLYLRWLSVAGWETGQLRYLVLPVITLALPVIAYIARLTRSAMLEVLGQDHIRVARAMGVPERRIVWKLAFRNALIPVLAVIGVTFAWSLGNAILVEAVFSRPGLGSTILKAILARDYQLVQAGVLVLAAAVVLLNTALDLLYGAIDPRLRRR